MGRRSGRRCGPVPRRRFQASLHPARMASRSAKSPYERNRSRTGTARSAPRGSDSGCMAASGRGRRSPGRRCPWRCTSLPGRARARRGRPARGPRRSGRGGPAWPPRWSRHQGKGLVVQAHRALGVEADHSLEAVLPTAASAGPCQPRGRPPRSAAVPPTMPSRALASAINILPGLDRTTGKGCSLHMLVEEGENFFRMPSEVVVPVLEAPRGALDPEQFLVLASQQIEGLLSVLRISGSGVPEHLDHEHGHLHPGAERCGVISAANQPPIFSNSRSMSS
jgi:hypothetical protein